MAEAFTFVRLVIVVAGVSGSGKSAVGARLAERLGWPFQDGDALHPDANIAKMRRGEPLDDSDRIPWLDATADWIAGRLAAGGGGVIACSALKRAYRDRLRDRGGRMLRFVVLDPDETTLRTRLAARSGHFMPAGLLASQLATLERPGRDENVLVLDRSSTVDQFVETIMRVLGLDAH